MRRSERAKPEKVAFERSLGKRASLFSLPLTEKNKLWMALAVGTFAMTTYKIAGEVSLRNNPRLLSFSNLDLAIPFVPWTVWIYMSVYLIYLASVLLQRDLAVLGRFLGSYIIAYGIAMFFFVLYPTTFPRELFPIPEGSGASGKVLEYFRLTDRPTNCLPSLHVSSCVMVTLPFWSRRPKLFFIFSLWTLAISVTTLTTKQHYFIDVVTGGLFGAICYHATPWVQGLLSRTVGSPSRLPPSNQPPAG
jgi:membrane-associated phospholipid phosphatase